MPLPTLESSTSSLALSAYHNDDAPTFFENVFMIYFRDVYYNCINSRVYGSKKLSSCTNFFLSLAVAPKTGNDYLYLKDELVSPFPVLVWEEVTNDGIIGVVTGIIEINEFNRWFINLILKSSKVTYSLSTYPKSQQYTEVIVDIFARMIKNTTPNDKWEDEGKEFFTQRVDFFTSRGLKIEAILPAFPCKSSNPDKVSGDLPDKGEEMALKTLCNFALCVKEVYPPGMVIWVVSDGHVFSDCIGVDDTVVNKYGEALKNSYKAVNKSEEELVKFLSLVDLFDLKKNPIKNSELEDIELEHHIRTEIEETSETCRKILMKGCDTDCGQLKRDIDTPGHPRLSLFRGFSKFMDEDLKQHPSIATVSRKKQKKIIARVAFEMIKRNDAYSNLVDLMFPLHLRFSIHAHDNSGPKFGIRLLSNQRCKVIKSLEEVLSPNYDDLLHIPTPWHNTILVVENDPTHYITRTSAIMEAMMEGTHLGAWNKQNKCYELVSSNKKNDGRNIYKVKV